MVGNIPATQVVFAPQNNTEMTYSARLPASADSVARFEQLMYAPAGSQASSSMASSGVSGLRQYMENMSNRWDAGQGALQNLMKSGEISSKDLVMTQMQMMNCALEVEVSAKCASLFENGVQTLTQRA